MNAETEALGGSQDLHEAADAIEAMVAVLANEIQSLGEEYAAALRLKAYLASA